MKLFTNLLLFFAVLLLFNFKSSEIPVTIHFNFDKNIQFEKGTITIKETKQIFEITSLQDLNIPLKKGKYTIIFSAEKFNKVWLSKRINEKDKVFKISISETKIVEIAPQISEENIVEQIELGNANFLNFGLGSADYTEFKKKYGVGNHNLGCVIAGNMSEEAKLNNQYIAKYLDEKYGENWRKDVPFLPWGLE